MNCLYQKIITTNLRQTYDKLKKSTQKALKLNSHKALN